MIRRMPSGDGIRPSSSATRQASPSMPVRAPLGVHLENGVVAVEALARASSTSGPEIAPDGSGTRWTIACGSRSAICGLEHLGAAFDQRDDEVVRLRNSRRGGLRCRTRPPGNRRARPRARGRPDRAPCKPKPRLAIQGSPSCWVGAAADCAAVTSATRRPARPGGKSPAVHKRFRLRSSGQAAQAARRIRRRVEADAGLRRTSQRRSHRATRTSSASPAIWRRYSSVVASRWAIGRAEPRSPPATSRGGRPRSPHHLGHSIRINRSLNRYSGATSRLRLVPKRHVGLLTSGR